jgi:HEAT repeat protein
MQVGVTQRHHHRQESDLRERPQAARSFDWKISLVARKLFILGFIFTLCVVGWSLWRYSFLRQKTPQEYIQDLTHRKSAIRAMSAYDLGRLQIKEAVGPLIAALRDPAYEVRWNAAVALGNIGDPRAIEPLREALRDPDLSVQVCAVRSLGKFRRPELTRELLPYLKASDRGLRMAACWGVGELGDPTLATEIIPLLNDPDQEVRFVAAIELGRFKNEEAKKVLEKIKQSKTHFYREKATEVLEKYYD